MTKIVRIEIDGSIYKELGPFKHGDDAQTAYHELRQTLQTMKEQDPTIRKLAVLIEMDEPPREPREPYNATAVSAFCAELRARARAK